MAAYIKRATGRLTSTLSHSSLVSRTLHTTPYRMALLPTRKIGNDDVTAVGYGAMGIAAFYGKILPDEERFKVSAERPIYNVQYLLDIHLYRFLTPYTTAAVLSGILPTGTSTARTSSDNGGLSCMTHAEYALDFKCALQVQADRKARRDLPCDQVWNRLRSEDYRRHARVRCEGTRCISEEARHRPCRALVSTPVSFCETRVEGCSCSHSFAEPIHRYQLS